MNKKKIFCLLLAVTIHRVTAQNFIIYPDKTFGGNKGDAGPLIIQNSVSKFTLLGTSNTNVSGDKTDPVCDTSFLQEKDAWILKIDTGYNIYWNKSLGGNKPEVLISAVATGYNKQIIFSCRTTSDSVCDKSEHNRGSFFFNDYWICLIDSNGNKVWDKTYGSSNTDDVATVTRLTTGDYILTGTSGTVTDGDKTAASHGLQDYWTLKLDSAGNKLWDKCYGGAGMEYSSGGNRVLSLFPDDSGSFIITGATASPVSGDVSDSSRGGIDIWIIKLDSAGNKIWDHRFGGALVEYANYLIRTNDKGYILCGQTTSPQGGDVSDTSKGGLDCWIIKMDSLGNKQWDRKYGGSGSDGATSIIQTLDNGYLVLANTQSDSSSDVTEHPYGINDYWIFKIDSSGNKIWDKRFGGPGINGAINFILMPDSSIYICGSADSGTTAVKTDPGKGLADYWLVHFKYTDNNTGIQENTNENNLVSIYPNPAKDIIYISTKNNFKPAYIYIYDAAGRKVMDKKLSSPTGRSGGASSSFSIKELNAGIYFYEIKDAKGNAGRGKVVKN